MNLSFVVIYLLKGQQNVEWDLVKTKYANAHMHILLKMPTHCLTDVSLRGRHGEKVFMCHTLTRDEIVFV